MELRDGGESIQRNREGALMIRTKAYNLRHNTRENKNRGKESHLKCARQRLLPVIADLKANYFAESLT